MIRETHTVTQRSTNVNGYIAPGSSQTTLDTWLSNRNAIKRPTAKRHRCDDNYELDFMCNNAKNNAWEQLSISE